ncbi:MAG: hypothetical protein ACJAX4_003570 [Clostridium sp.]
MHREGGIVEEKLQKIVKLYFDGYSVSEAIRKVSLYNKTKEEPFTEGPNEIIQ